jgi:hypothetical protein
MCRLLGWRLATVLLFAFGASIVGPALDPGFDLPSDQHYDGDADDAGLVGKIGAHGIDAAPSDTRVAFIPSVPRPLPAPTGAPEPLQVIREAVASRGPPV